MNSNDSLRNRSAGIDLLRALAVLLVLGAHMDACPSQTSGVIHSLTDIWNRGGWTGVDLFFVLSGFLVSGLLFREYEKYGSISAKSFLIRRGFKIYPGFWLLIIVTVAVDFILRHPAHPHTVLSELFFVQNYRSALWPHTWSLAVEEHFYLLLLIFMVFVSARRKFSIIPYAFAFLALVCLGLRLWTSARFSDVVGGNGAVVFRQIFPTHLRIDSLFFGVLISYFYHRHGEKLFGKLTRLRPLLIPVGLLLFVPAFVFPVATTPFIYTWGLAMFYLGSGSLLCAMLVTRLSTNVVARSLAYIGSHSYSIYLWHVAVLRWLIPACEPILPVKSNWYCYFALFMFLSIVLGILMALAVEFPMLRIRDKWFPSRSQPLKKVTDDKPGHHKEKQVA